MDLRMHESCAISWIVETKTNGFAAYKLKSAVGLSVRSVLALLLCVPLSLSAHLPFPSLLSIISTRLAFSDHQLEGWHIKRSKATSIGDLEKGRTA
jgi:hypothetical protein